MGRMVLNTDIPFTPLPCPHTLNAAVSTLKNSEIPRWAELWPRKQSFTDSGFSGEMPHSLPLASEHTSAPSNTALKSAFYRFPFSLPNANAICEPEKYAVLPYLLWHKVVLSQPMMNRSLVQMRSRLGISAMPGGPWERLRDWREPRVH